MGVSTRRRLDAHPINEGPDVIVTEMTRKECREALAQTRFGRLACARDNQPYIIPIFFAVDDDHLYSFSIAGRKIDWMRDNPRVCLEVDDVKSWQDWTSVVALGLYEEIPDTPDWQAERRHAHSLLQQRAMWWQPASVDILDHAGEVFLPIFFRIVLDDLTGRRGLAAPEETLPAASHEGARGGWWWQLFRPAEPRH
jgi:nitroimidazol reductase NimA-like FMN-containing flavoprotein (pyridoxamine 5'-phosphate oxidase superfamily)